MAVYPTAVFPNDAGKAGLTSDVAAAVRGCCSAGVNRGKRGGTGGSSGVSGSVNSPTSFGSTPSVSTKSDPAPLTSRDKVLDAVHLLLRPQKTKWNIPTASKQPPIIPRPMTTIQAGPGRCISKLLLLLSLRLFSTAAAAGSLVLPALTPFTDGNISTVFVAVSSAAGMVGAMEVVKDAIEGSLVPGSSMARWEFFAGKPWCVFNFCLASSSLWLITAAATPPAAAAAAPMAPRTIIESFTFAVSRNFGVVTEVET